MKLAIVLTVYNKELYLRRALESLLTQKNVSPDEFEVLAVNDGCTDGSATILAEYAKRDSRVKILTQKNQGLSMARNNGVNATQSDYVWFVDADDSFSSKAVRLICDAMSSSPDVIPIYGETEGMDLVRNQIPITVNTGKEVLLSEKWEPCGVFWVLRRRFLQDNQLRFMPSVYHEDDEFTPRMLYAAKSVTVIPEVLYTVHKDPYGITQVPRAKRAFDYLMVSCSLSKFLADKRESETQIGEVIYTHAAMCINNGFSIIVKNNWEEQVKFNNLFRGNIHLLMPPLQKATKIKYRLEAFLFRMFPIHYVGIYKMMKLMC